MTKAAALLIFILPCFNASAQREMADQIRAFQESEFEKDKCLDFIRANQIPGVDASMLQQIIIIRHGEPAMDKKGWKNRKEAIKYTQMYDAVGVYDFDVKPICLNEMDIPMVFTSRLPRAINTAEKTLQGAVPMIQMDLFNEFERKIIEFPNIKLPMKFWSVTTRLVWVMGFNHKGIESFPQAKDRARDAALFLDKRAQRDKKVLLFAHGFLNRYIKKFLKEEGYEVVNLDGQKYLGAYYFYKTQEH